MKMLTNYKTQKCAGIKTAAKMKCPFYLSNSMKNALFSCSSWLMIWKNPLPPPPSWTSWIFHIFAVQCHFSCISWKCSKKEQIYNTRRWKSCTLTPLCAGCAVVIDCNHSHIHWKICILNAVQYFCHQTYIFSEKVFF